MALRSQKSMDTPLNEGVGAVPSRAFVALAPLRTPKVRFPAMKRSTAVVLIVALTCSFAGVPLWAQTNALTRTSGARKPNSSPLAETIRTLFGVRVFKQVAISPDGKKVAWVEALAGRGGQTSDDSAIYVADATGARAPRRITAGTGTSAHAESSVAWSPNSTYLAFTSDAAKRGQSQLYVTNAAGGPARKLTAIKGLLASPAWSPNGRTIAALVTRNVTRATGPLAAGTPQTGVIAEAITEQRLALVDVLSGALREISPDDMYVYEYDWSPDGQRFVTTAAHGSGDDHRYLAELYPIHATTGVAQ